MNNIAFFDSECIACNKFINFVLKIDKKKKVLFSGINSELYKSISINLDNIDSVIYFKDKKMYLYSDAIIEILKDSHSIFSILNLQYLIPFKWRKNAYNFFAKKRKKVPGSCILLINHPHKDRFI